MITGGGGVRHDYVIKKKIGKNMPKIAFWWHKNHNFSHFSWENRYTELFGRFNIKLHQNFVSRAFGAHIINLYGYF